MPLFERGLEESEQSLYSHEEGAELVFFELWVSNYLLVEVDEEDRVHGEGIDAGLERGKGGP